MRAVDRHAERKVESETRALQRQADALFARWSCPASAECCQLRQTGRQPWLYAGEWRVLCAELARQGRALPPPRADGACPFLDGGGRCSVYAARPLGCRTWFCARAKGPTRAPVAQMDALLSRLAAAHLAAGDQEMPQELIRWYDRAREGAPPVQRAAGRGPT